MKATWRETKNNFTRLHRLSCNGGKDRQLLLPTAKSTWVSTCAWRSLPLSPLQCFPLVQSFKSYKSAPVLLWKQPAEEKFSTSTDCGTFDLTPSVPEGRLFLYREGGFPGGSAGVVRAKMRRQQLWLGFFSLGGNGEKMLVQNLLRSVSWCKIFRQWWFKCFFFISS